MDIPGQPPRGWDEYTPFLFQWEGTKLENDPSDPGGLTKYGIDQRSHPGVDIANLTAEQASAIHVQNYWGRTSASKLPFPLNFAYFDFAMNAGDGSAAKVAQQIVSVTVDGRYGPRTTQAVKDYILRNGAPLFLVKFTNGRELYYRNLAHARPSEAKDLNGWVKRSEACKTWCALRLVAEGAAE